MTLLLGILVVIWVVVGLFMILGELGIVKFLPFSLLNTTEQKTTPKPLKKVEVQSKPKVVKEVEKDEDVMANVEFFEKPILENKGFYESLTSGEKAEFNDLFVLDHPKHLVKELVYKINGENSSFFQKVFNFIFKYRKIISLTLLNKLFSELLRLAGNQPKTVALLNEAMIRTSYARRKDKAFFDKAFDISKADVVLQQTQLKPTNTYIYSFVRLAIILERLKQYDQALTIIDDAIKRNLNDKTVGGYAGRRIRVLEKKNKK
jgi:tetratricopeptide (TPR) repeat protein